jgi:hypothetical protein
MDRDLQPRAMMNAVTIAEYAEDMENGAVFPPVIVYSDQRRYWLADGFHRVEAAKRLGLPTIEAEVRPGTKRDALLWSVQANSTHGLRRTDADKRKAVLTLLQDEEWKDWSDREIARRTATSHTFVAKVRSLTGNVASERKYETRHGTVTTMETGGIAAANEARATQGSLEPEIPEPARAEREESRWAPSLTPSPRPQVPEEPEEEPVPRPARQPSAWAPSLSPSSSSQDEATPTPRPNLPPPEPQIPDVLFTLRVAGEGEDLALRHLTVSVGEDGRGPSRFYRGFLSELHRLVDRAAVHALGGQVLGVLHEHNGNGEEEPERPVLQDPEEPFEIGALVKWGSTYHDYGKVENYSGSGKKVYVRDMKGARRCFPTHMLEAAELEVLDG